MENIHDSVNNDLYYFNFANLNLIYPNDRRSLSFTYDVITYSNGQKNILLKYRPMGPNCLHKIKIIYRLNSFSDLELLICAVKVLKHEGYSNFELYCPYFFGSENFILETNKNALYYKDVISPIINSLNFSSVKTYNLDISYLKNVINNLHNDYNYELLIFTLSKIYFKEAISDILDRFIILTTNGESFKTVINVSEKIGKMNIECTINLLHSETKEIIKSFCSKNDFENKDVIIIDDFVDGGTKVNKIAEEIKNKNVGNIYLIATHGVFLYGFSELYLNFKKVFTSNSHSDLDMEDTFKIPVEHDKQIPIKRLGDFVEQFNIFK